MSAPTRTSYDPETVAILSSVLKQAADALPVADQTQERKTRLASNILSAAAAGERDLSYFIPRRWPFVLSHKALAGC